MYNKIKISSFVLFNRFFLIRHLNLLNILKQKKLNYNFYYKLNLFKNLKKLINNIYKIIQKGYIFKLITKGLGFNFFKTINCFKINVNNSHSFIIKNNLKIKIVITKTYIYFYSFSKELILKYIYILYKLKKINKYKNVGILLDNKIYKYKIGKRKK